MKHRSDRGSAFSALLGLVLGAISIVALATLGLALKKTFVPDTGGGAPVAKKGETKKDETANPEPGKPEPAKPEPGKPEPARPEPGKPEPAKPEPAKPVEEEAPQFKASELQASIEKSVTLVNYVGVVVHLLEMANRGDRAVPLRGLMMSEGGRIRTYLSMLERSGGGKISVEYLRSDDRIDTFDGLSLKDKKNAADAQMRIFIVSTRARPKATIGLLRGNLPVTFQFVVKEPPAGWVEFMMDLTEEETDPIAKADPPKPEPGKPEPKPEPGKPTPPKPEPPKPGEPAKPVAVPSTVFETLTRADARKDVNYRGAAAFEFKRLAAANPACAGWFSAARYFLEGDDVAWGVEKNPGAQALADYFEAQRIKEVGSFDAERHLEAARHLAPKAKDRKTGEIFRIFAMGHIADASARNAPDAKVRSAAESCGLVLTDDRNRWGDVPGVSVASIMYWMGMNQGQKALDVYAKYKSQGDSGTRFAAAFAEFSLALTRQTYDWEGFHRKLMEFQKLCKDPEDAASFEMLAAMVRSIAGCLVCKGGTQLGCPTCQGTGESARLTCPSCKGASAGAVDDRYRKTGQTNCGKCNNTGYAKGKCQPCNGSGRQQCDSCRGRGWKTQVSEGSIWNLFNRTDCWRCQGSGTVIPGAACRCGSCRGLGYSLTPKR